MENTNIHPNALPREERLRRRGAVSQLFAEGESGFVFPIKYIFRSSGESDSPTSVLFTTPKRFHKRANKRNLLRRRVKEAYRLQKSLLGEAVKGYNIALIYSTKELHDYSKIEASVAKILKQIAERSSESV